MAYQVLARKWRPRNFKEMVGQVHVLKVLVNALDSERLHHAYLFTGTRGVGKTTIARIFAKSLNCEKGITSEPCGTCPACKDIDAGRFVDLLEVDAASRTKVDETRELLDNVQYAPARGRYKVYLIDEVHMLSISSFNALLKTLEEPPPHVKFLLATTDPQKLPATVLSRCLQFNLKRLPVEQISKHLQDIVEAETVEYEFPVFALLAKAADGSMRDALSLLDQAIAFGGGKLLKGEVANMLGTLEQDAAPDLLAALADNNGPALLGRVAQMAEFNPDYAGVLGDLLALLQRVALAQVVPETLDKNQEDYETVLGLCNRVAAEDVQLFYQIGLLGRRDLPLAPDPRGGFEMALLRMLAFRPATGGDTPPPRPAPPAPPPLTKSVPPPLAEPIPPPAPKPPPPPPAAPAPPPAVEGDWAATVRALGLSGMAKVLAEHCSLKNQQEGTIHLALPPTQAAQKTPNQEQRLQEALEKYYAKPIKLTISVEEIAAGVTPAAQRQQEAHNRRQAALRELKSDPVIQALEETFDARLDEESIRITASE